MARIDIVGGGIAGLILAIALKDSEHQVVLHEPLRGTDLTEADTALGLWHPALLALDRVGVGDAVRRFGTPITEARMGTADGRVLGRITGQDVLLLGRVSLRDLLLDALPARVSWDDSRVQDVTALPGDLIVGADGARSVVRSTYWGNSAHPAHVTVVRGVLDEDRSTGILEEFWGDGGVFGLTPLPAAVGAPGPARTNWFAAFREHRFASTEDALGHVRHLAAPFPQRVQDAMRAAAPEQTKVNGISVSPATRSFVRGRAVLIGDAAHAMTPNGGHGATEAIQDGAVLGEFIGRWGLREGGARYGRRRVVLPQVIRLGSSVITQLALARGGAARARDLLARR